MELIFKETNDYNFNISEILNVLDLENDDVSAILINICEIFECSNMITFVVSGFGQEKWPVDCRTDLATIMEQIPDIQRNIKEGTFSFLLDFYEQGIERQLVFKDEGEFVSVTCNCRTNWIPNPSNILMNKIEVVRMIENLLKNFIECSSVLCIGWADNHLFTSWKQQFEFQ